MAYFWHGAVFVVGSNFDNDADSTRAVSLVGIINNLGTLISHGANVDSLVSNLEPRDIGNNLNTLIEHGANIDNLVSNLDSRDVVKHLDILVGHGADIDDIVHKLDVGDIAGEVIDTLIEHGADVDELMLKLGPKGIDENYSVLFRRFDMDILETEFKPFGIIKNIDTLRIQGWQG